MSAALTGCGLLNTIIDKVTDQAEEPGAVTQTTDSSGGSDDAAPDNTADTESDTQEDTKTDSVSPLDDMVGSWTCICTTYSTEYASGDIYGSSYMFDEDYSPESRVIVRRDGDRYIADYLCELYELETRIYGTELTFKNDAAYRDCPNQDWCALMEDPFKDMDSTERKLTMYDDMLIESEEYFYKAGDSEYDEDYYSITTHYYLPEGSPRLNDPESLRYFDTVTVSDAGELLNSIQNNRKIILEAGTYDLTGVFARDLDNYRITTEDYKGYTINNVYNLCLEAKDGADVTISVDDPYFAVLSLYDCGNVKFTGLTFGHDVEPGYCTGSVLNLGSSSDIYIEECKLFGSGTYGIETDYCYGVYVDDSDIYECTYGLLDLTGTSHMLFNGCSFRDSTGFDMIDMYNGCDATFYDCKFTGNECEYDGCDFVSMDEYSSASFTNCEFKDNVYSDFCDRDVNFDNCTIDGVQKTYFTLDKLATADDIMRAYEKTRARDKEIDDEIYEGLADQLTLNELCYEDYTMWDSLLNGIWGYLGDTLSESDMEALRTEQKKWIKEKEDAMQQAAAEFEGGSMQPQIEYGTGARVTRERVEVLIHKYLEE